MRRSTLSLLRCPRCLSGPLVAPGDRPAVEFGPIRCAACESVFPLADGILDLAAQGSIAGDPTPAQRLLSSRAVARVYDRGVRSAFLTLLARARLDFDSEQLLVQALLDPPPGAPILDLSCGTCAHARRLALDPSCGPVIGVDLSLAMLDEAVHHLREQNAAVDLLRAECERLPMLDGTIGAVLNVGAFHLYPDPRAVLGEVARVLKPGGRFVCATVTGDDAGALHGVEARLGLHRHSEETLRSLCHAAGLDRFERVRLPPIVVLRVTKS